MPDLGAFKRSRKTSGQTDFKARPGNGTSSFGGSGSGDGSFGGRARPGTGGGSPGGRTIGLGIANRAGQPRPTGVIPNRTSPSGGPHPIPPTRPGGTTRPSIGPGGIVSGTGASINAPVRSRSLGTMTPKKSAAPTPGKSAASSGKSHRPAGKATKARAYPGMGYKSTPAKTHPSLKGRGKPAPKTKGRFTPRG